MKHIAVLVCLPARTEANGVTAAVNAALVPHRSEAILTAGQVEPASERWMIGGDYCKHFVARPGVPLGSIVACGGPGNPVGAKSAPTGGLLCAGSRRSYLDLTATRDAAGIRAIAAYGEWLRICAETSEAKPRWRFLQQAANREITAERAFELHRAQPRVMRAMKMKLTPGCPVEDFAVTRAEFTVRCRARATALDALVDLDGVWHDARKVSGELPDRLVSRSAQDSYAKLAGTYVESIDPDSFVIAVHYAF